MALTDTERTVLEIVRHECRLGDAVAAGDVRERAYRRAVSSSSADRALRRLTDRGLLTKPSRGFYLPAGGAS